MCLHEKLTISFILIFFAAGCASNQNNESVKSPVEPEHVLETLQLADPDLEIELFVSEPLVMDPVAMEVDENGDLYVVEMPGYPLDTEGSGRVRLLRDTNHDGKPDESIVFAEGFIFPKGIMRWKNGFLITDAPHLYYLEDTTGDGKADKREILLTGFARSNPQHNFNKPLYGIDNWIYLANRGSIHTELFAEELGDQGSEVMYYSEPDGPVLPVNADGRNVRFRPDHSELETLSTNSQYGHDFDEWGRHFLINNTIHVYHEMISKKYVDRNPAFYIHSAVHHSSNHSSDVFPVTENPLHQLLTDVGVFTSASSITFYSGGLFGKDYENVSFVAESQHNLVHTDIIRENGSVFSADRQFENKEFLASTDSWFRPVNFYIGPDGALYVIDYYRQIIEHPEWMDDETFQTMDLYAGIDRGRIYRITPKNADKADWMNRLDLRKRSAEDLVRVLNSDNIWWRRNAQRLLVDARDTEAIHHLQEQFFSSDNPLGRLHALWTLDGMDALEPELIHLALQDEASGVRENAITLAEDYINKDQTLLDSLLQLKNDESERVQYQLLLTLGFFDDPEINRARDEILFNHIEDPWFQLAALSAISVEGDNMLAQALLRISDSSSPDRENFFRHIGSIIAAGSDEQEIQEFLYTTAINLNEDDAWWQSAAFHGFANQIQRTGIDPSLIESKGTALSESFFLSNNSNFRRGVLQLLQAIDLRGMNESELLNRAEMISGDKDAEESLRADAIRLMGISGYLKTESFKNLLLDFVNPSEPAGVQIAALEILARIPDDDIGWFVMNEWDVMTPQVRDQAVNVMMSSPARISMLLDAVEENKVLISTIGWGRRVALMRDRGGGEEARILRDRARELLSRDPDARREAVVQYINAYDDDPGNKDRGKEIFQNNCSACHQMGGNLGVEFGPDATTFQHWSPQALITKILDPGRSVAEGFDMWMIELLNGDTISGVIEEETDQSLTIRQTNGAEVIISRTEIESVLNSNVSPMPEGMEQQIDESEMADLIQFIRSGGN